MKITQLKMSGLRSFTNETVFNLDNTPGLYFMTGDNRIEPRLGRNGTGKSTTWDALMWGLFGTTSRSLRNPALNSWGTKKGYWTEVDFKLGKDKYTLSRSWSPNKLELKHGNTKDTVTQEEVDSLLKINSSIFLSSSYVGQFTQSFFDLNPTAKLDLITGILNLQYWIDCSSKASEKARHTQAELDDLERGVSHTKGQLKSIREQISKTKERHDNYISIMKANRREISLEITKQRSDMSLIKQRLGKARKSKEKAEKLVTETKNKLEQAAQEWETYENCLTRAQSKLAIQREYIKELEQGIKTPLGSVCDECGQKITVEYAKRHKKALQKKLKEAETKEQGMIIEFASNQELVKTSRNVVNELNQKLRENENIIRESNTSISVYKDSLSRSKTKINELFKRKENTTNPYMEQLKEQRANRTILKEDLHEKEERKDKIATSLSTIKYWVGGFREVRLFETEQILAAMEVQINNNLERLGLIDWSILLDIERETSSGGTTKSFTVYVKAPNGNENLVPWESWSGGESQRLRVAGAAGMIDLVADRVGVAPSLEIWDEPSQHIGETGITDLVEFLKNRAMENNKQIWLVDHRSIDYEFDGMVTVVKDKQGSRIEVDK